MLRDSKTNSYILLTDKKAQKSLEQFADEMKEAKKVSESWKLTFYKGQDIKPLNINLASNSEYFRKKFCNLMTQFIQFTEQKI